jgi:hypothetical protein
MSREEAIEIFNTVLFFGRCDAPKEEIEEAMTMAIQALEQEPILDKIRAEIEGKYGIKLPKGHGRIIDESKIMIGINNAPTIIKAESEG